MSDPIKGIDEEIETLRNDEIPEIDIEMAIQRKYPDQEHDVVPHDGEPGLKQGQKARRCMDTQGNYGTPCPNPAKYECYHHKVKQGKVFPICGSHAYIAGIQQHVEPVQRIYNCNECQLATTFGEDKDMYGGGTNMDAFPKGAKLTVMQQIKMNKIAQNADWIQKQRLEEAREKLKQQKAAPPASDKQQVSAPTQYDVADKLFYKEYYGAASSGDAGMRYGYERIPVMIYSKLMRPGIETKRRGLKWDTLTPQEFEVAFDAMFETAEAAKKRALAHMNQRSDGPVNRKKP